MKKLENNPVAKFKSLLKGSKTARNLTFIYVILSITLAYKMRDQIEYVIPLILGALLILWYALTHLMLKGINLKKNTDLKNQFNKYKKQTLRREKYEFTIMFIWILTIIPAYLYNQDITVFTVLKWMVVLYIVIVVGDIMFNKVKKDLKDLEHQINSLDTKNLEF